ESAMVDRRIAETAAAPVRPVRADLAVGALPQGVRQQSGLGSLEAYSDHAVEVQTNYRRNCCRERVDGPPVVGVHDPPVLEMRDCLLDHPADLVDLGIKFFLPAEQLAACRLLERSDHAVA